MNLESTTINLRARNGWEALDLGLAMYQQYALQIWRAQLLAMAPIIAISFLAFGNNAVWFQLAIWWFKPWYDRMMLAVLGDAVFGKPPTTRALIARIPQILGTGLLQCLTIYRLDPSRSFNLPVWQLERLKGKARWNRAAILGKRSRNMSIGLTMALVHIEILTIMFGLMLLVVMFMPDVFDFSLIDYLDSELPEDHIYAWIWALGYTISIFVIEPLYVASGFALYLNRRINLEGWDIELGLRRLQQRLEAENSETRSKMKRSKLGVAGAIGFATLLFLGADSSKTALADSEQSAAVNSGTELKQAPYTATEAKEILEKIYDRDEFGKPYTESKLRFKERTRDRDEEEEPETGSDWSESDAQQIATVIKFSVITLIIVGLALVVYYARRWEGLWERDRKEDAAEMPTSIAGVRLDSDELTGDIVQAAREALQAGDLIGALSLLYRGSLLRLIKRRHVAFNSGATEYDCLRLVKRHFSATTFEYFSALTREWLRLVYAKRNPRAEKVSELIDGFRLTMEPES